MARKLRKCVRFISDTIDRILLILFLFIFLIGAYSVYDSYIVYQNAVDNSLLRYKPGEEESDEDLRPIEDMKAWLTIDNTPIDFPIMQGENNSVYLNKDPYGDYSLSGSIFLDCRNTSDFTDDYNLVYGHHMEQGAMFGALDEYLDRDYFLEHRTGTLTVKDTAYKLVIFAVLNCSAEEHAIFDVDGSDISMEYIRDHHIYLEEPENMHLITLSTCKTPRSLERTVVTGCLIKQS